MKKIIGASIVALALLGGSALADDGVWNQVEGNWDQFKGSVQENWGDLTDDEVDQLSGKKDQFVGFIKEKYGIAQEEVEAQVDEWAEKLDRDS